MYLKLDGQLMADLPWPSCTRPTCGDKQRLEKVPRPDTSGSHRTFGQPWPQWTARCGFAPHRKSCTWWIIPKFESVKQQIGSLILLHAKSNCPNWGNDNLIEFQLIEIVFYLRMRDSYTNPYETNRIFWDFWSYESDPRNESFENCVTKRIHETNLLKIASQNESTKQIFSTP